MSNTDWKAAMSSEIFREYVKNELIKEAADLKSLTEAHMMPSMDDWEHAGISLRDLKEFKTNAIAKAKINLALRDMGYTTGQMAKFIGHDNVMDVGQARELIGNKPGFSGLHEISKWVEEELDKPKPGEVLDLKALEEHKVLAELEEFQAHVNANPHLKKAFKQWQNKFATDPVYRSKVNPQFVEGVMLLDLNDSSEE